MFHPGAWFNLLVSFSSLLTILPVIILATAKMTILSIIFTAVGMVIFLALTILNMATKEKETYFGHGGPVQVLTVGEREPLIKYV
jgi:hypothetical protein